MSRRAISTGTPNSPHVRRDASLAAGPADTPCSPSSAVSRRRHGSHRRPTPLHHSIPTAFLSCRRRKVHRHAAPAPRMTTAGRADVTRHDRCERGDRELCGGPATTAPSEPMATPTGERQPAASRRKTTPLQPTSARSATARATCGWTCRSAIRTLVGQCSASAKSGRSPTASGEWLRLQPQASKLDLRHLRFRNSRSEAMACARPTRSPGATPTTQWAGWSSRVATAAARRTWPPLSPTSARTQGARSSSPSCPDLLDHLRAAFAPTSELTYDALFDRVRESGLLVLDDLGAERDRLGDGEALPADQLPLQLSHANRRHYQPSSARAYG